MTDQPPPPPGNYPPPPPPPGGYPPPPPQGGGYPPPPPPQGGGYLPPQAAMALTRSRPRCRSGAAHRGLHAVAHSRVGVLIDFIPVVSSGHRLRLLIGTQETAASPTRPNTTSASSARPARPRWAVSVIIAVLLSHRVLLWNYGYRQGTTGSSIGKSIMKFKVVSEKTGQPIGFGMSIVRQLAAHHRRCDLLHRLSVPAVGRQAADDRRQDHDNGLRAALGTTTRTGR